MSKEIRDRATIKFATSFYNALLSGESVEFAYKLGCSKIQLEGIPEYLTPVLKKKPRSALVRKFKKFIWCNATSKIILDGKWV